MKKIFLFLIFSFITQLAFAQTPTDVLTPTPEGPQKTDIHGTLTPPTEEEKKSVEAQAKKAHQKHGQQKTKKQKKAKKKSK